jgi:hypothetical protein
MQLANKDLSLLLTNPIAHFLQHTQQQAHER